MQKKIPVLHIIKSLGRGGAEMLLPETLKLHDKNQFDFHYLYFLPWKDQMVDSLTRAGGKVHCFTAKNNLQLLMQARKVARYVRENDIRLIHAHLPWAGILARLVGRMAGIPVLYTEHNKQERYHIGTRMANLTTMNWLTGLIAVSADVEQSVRKHKSPLKIPLHVILNGVNTVHFAPDKRDGAEEVRRKFGISDQAPLIGTIAVFRFQKRLDVWLQTAHEILKSVPEARFIIVGDGPLRPMLEEKRKTLGLEDVVFLAGLETEVRPYLAAFDLYMMCSVFEGLPIALLEAMASGCPVITTAAGGIREVVQHDQDGLVCAVDQPEKLTGFAVELIGNPQKRKTLGLNGRKTIIERFSMDKMVNELETLYRKTLGRG